MRLILRRLCLLLTASLAWQGCGTFGLGERPVDPGAISFESPDFVVAERLPMEKVWKAIEAALGSLNDLELIPIKKEKDGLGAVVEARGAGDKRIRIKLRPTDTNATEIRIRIGTFGDPSYARQLYDSIRRNY